MLGSAARLTARAGELAQAHVSVGEVGELVEEAVTQALSLVELTGVNQVDGAIGHLVEPLAIVVGSGLAEGARGTDGWWRCITALMLAGSEGGGLIVRQAALLVLLAAAAGTGLVASDLGHGVDVSLLKLIDGAAFIDVGANVGTFT